MSSYAPFITEGRVSLLDVTVEVPIKILRDTGAVDSFILESILPFSSQSETGERLLVQGNGFEYPISSFPDSKICLAHLWATTLLKFWPNSGWVPGPKLAHTLKTDSNYLFCIYIYIYKH